MTVGRWRHELTRPRVLLLSLLAAAVVAGAATLAYLRSSLSAPPDPAGAVLSRVLRDASSIPSARATACGRCHGAVLERWKGSQHAWANRLVDPSRDGEAFKLAQHVVETRPLRSGNHPPVAVIGVEPLRQYLVPFPGGRLQAFDVAFDPGRREWFSVFPGENRQPHEWGFWTNRGLNWNSQCAACHMTGVRKGYDIASDTYRTTWDEMGVSCAQCHGAMPRHAARGGAVDVDERVSAARTMDVCGSCHARREELTGAFRPGEGFFDHYRLMLPDARGIYYADGQVHEESFEYGSFVMSRMGNHGVTCLDCHDPHSGKLRLPMEGNALCLSCHRAPGQRGAPVVDPVAHGRHQPGTQGAACVGCHMPATTYMARDARRDHGFTSPDPGLTTELGIPNACNRCHSDRTPQWAQQWTDRWYRDTSRRVSRERAHVIAGAQRRGDAAVVPGLLSLMTRERNPAWRATLTALLALWSDRPEAAQALGVALGDEHPLVRAAAVRALETNRAALPLILPRRNDPVRLVRLDAMLTTFERARGIEEGRAELDAYLAVGSDQPAGALRQARIALAEGRPELAERWMRAAVSWDPESAVLYDMLGRVLNVRGKNDEAEAAFIKAAELEPRNAAYPYALALLYGEVGRVPEALAALKKTVALDPRFGRAWYNLGLAYAQRGLPQESLAALARAEALMPRSPDPLIARAAVLRQLGDTTSARKAEAKARQLREAP